MATDAVVFASVAWALASALGVALFGLLTLSGGRSRPPGAFPFGLFAVTWGFQISFANLAGVVGSPELARTFYLLDLACFIPLAFFLIEFAGAQSSWGRHHRLFRTLRGLAVFVGATAALTMVLAPARLLAGTQVVEGAHFVQWGPWATPLIFGPTFLAFGIALVALQLSQRHSPTPRIQSRAAILVAGLGMYVAYAASNNLTFYAALALDGDLGRDLPLALVFLALLVATGYVITSNIQGFRDARTPTERRRAAWIVAALGIPVLWGPIEAVLSLMVVPALQTAGVWRLAGVTVIALGLARWWLVDLPQRMQRVASRTTGVAGAVAGGATAYGAGALVSTGVAFPVVAGVLVSSVSLVPSLRFAKRLFSADGRERNPIAYEQALYEQRIEAYRAALEASMARGTLDDDRAFLDSLRGRFDISEEEDRVLRYYAKSSVVITREGDIAGSYERLRLLGEGAEGRTWLARDKGRERLVVLKEPLARWQREGTIIKRVWEEAQMAARVRHPNVVNVEEVVEHQGHPVMIMEYLEGGSLADRLREKGVLEWREASKVLHDVLSGVAAVHARGIVHRDIKPSNVLLTADGTAKVADFGIAIQQPGRGRTMVDADEGDASVALAGTRGYIAPEVAGGRAPDERADVYACAAVLHECLYGTPPGSDGGAHAVIADNNIPPELQAVIAKGLAERPSRRFASARAFADELVKVGRT